MSEPTPPPPETGANAATKLLDELKLGLRRFTHGDFQTIHATTSERAELAAAKKPLTAELAQDYAAWRKSMLVMATVFFVVAALFALVKFQTIEDISVEGALAQAKQEGRQTTEAEVREAVRKNFGASNLETLAVAQGLEIAVILLSTLLTLLAARSWASVRRSRRMARRAWYVWILLPIGMALVPWTALLDFGHLEPAQAKAIKASMGVVLGLAMTISLGPRILSLFPGVIRSALILKTLVPETSLPAWLAAICAPIYILVLVLVIAMINQTNGDALLFCGTVSLMLAPLSYLRYMRALLRPLDGATAAQRVREARTMGYVFNGLGGLLLFIFVIRLEMFSWDAALQMVATAVGGLLLVMVVSSDFMLAILRVSFQQAAALHGTEMAASLEARLDALSEGGLTELRTPAEDEPSEGKPGEVESKDG